MRIDYLRIDINPIFFNRIYDDYDNFEYWLSESNPRYSRYNHGCVPAIGQDCIFVDFIFCDNKFNYPISAIGRIYFICG